MYSTSTEQLTSIASHAVTLFNTTLGIIFGLQLSWSVQKFDTKVAPSFMIDPYTFVISPTAISQIIALHGRLPVPECSLTVIGSAGALIIITLQSCQCLTRREGRKSIQNTLTLKGHLTPKTFFR